MVRRFSLKLIRDNLAVAIICSGNVDSHLPSSKNAMSTTNDFAYKYNR